MTLHNDYVHLEQHRARLRELQGRRQKRVAAEITQAKLADDSDLGAQTRVAGPGHHCGMTTPALTLALVVTAATVPYLTLKIAWLTRGAVGLRDPAVMQTSTFRVANGITLGLDSVVVLIAWTLACSPRRLLLAVVTPFVWCATGLMATPALA